ncbi:MAG: conserved exported protein of unknown function [Nitrospira sp.]|nr:hypothetical protein [Nitrospira sp.]ULA57940.1 MAG: conserved exported protein of unknown function [Nitrospira sp.]
MMYSRFHGAVVLSLSLLVLSACATEETMTSSGSTQAASASGSMKTTAQAQAYDSLQSCLNRIPSSGTAGNRMIAEESCRRDETLRQSIAGNATTKSGNRAAAGAAGDSLEACMARIPKDGSVGQRMLAEESCKRDQANQR